MIFAQSILSGLGLSMVAIEAPCGGNEFSRSWQSCIGEQQPPLDNRLQKCSFPSDVSQHQQQHITSIPLPAGNIALWCGEGDYSYGGQKTYQVGYAVSYAHYSTAGWIPPAVINSGPESRPRPRLQSNSSEPWWQTMGPDWGAFFRPQ